MNHGSLFSGIGGFDLAASWMEWENIFHCEWNPFGQKILKYYWPNATSYTDIKQTDFSVHRGTIDIITGGFPCQPYSMAGKRKGKEDDRHLWTEMLRAIREVQPRWIVGENVSGLLNWNRGMVLDEIKADMEAEGFEVLPSLILPACAVNAPHRRDRVWIIAHATSIRKRKLCSISEKRNIAEEWTETSEGFKMLVSNGLTTNTSSIESQRRLYKNRTGKAERYISTCDAWNNERPGWEDFPTQPPLCSRNDGLSGELAGITFSRHRAESIKAYGNAIVPQVVYQIFKAIQEMEDSFNTKYNL